MTAEILSTRIHRGVTIWTIRRTMQGQPARFDVQITSDGEQAWHRAAPRPTRHYPTQHEQAAFMAALVAHEQGVAA